MPSLAISAIVKTDDDEPINIPVKTISMSDIDFSVSMPLLKGNYEIIVTSYQAFTANMMMS